MSDAELYASRAERLEKLAREMTSQAHKEQLLAIAKDWRAMAERSVQREKRSFNRGGDV